MRRVDVQRRDVQWLWMGQPMVGQGIWLGPCLIRDPGFVPACGRGCQNPCVMYPDGYSRKLSITSMFEYKLDFSVRHLTPTDTEDF